MGKGDYLKYSNDEIEIMLDFNGYKWIDGEYTNRNSKIVIEDIQGYKGLCRIGGLMEGKTTKMFFSKNPFTLDNIQLWLKNNSEYALNSKEYRGAYEPMDFECSKHGKFTSTWNKIYQGVGCPMCANNIKYTIEQVKDYLRKTNPNITVISKEYSNAFEYLECKCAIDGYTWKSNWHNLNINKNGCPECKRKMFLGVNNPRYNEQLTTEERELKRSMLGEGYHIWRNSVFERDDYTCVRCGSSKSGTLNAHHIDGYNWNIEGRTDLNNGVTLCEDCHTDFHNKYGYGDNTSSQYEEWIKINEIAS